ncbi:catalase HPII [Pseudomonas syringae pv. actinidiae]|uniref:catalase HPII n=1 Tax=Pseudomonas syringae TaxID=317 RepID=UPI000464D5DC|nr:catalase HPII [Pseudomonas syringae]AYL13630.1 catalase HPII [Pseudomonas syringae pv. actinidiae]AYL83538.1 catalase HPII [Pseudomonas syringae pv. actinidiae str. Shaanxi_M228]MBL3606616.1 catalase HPII [Pseudomonas syringae pv. actinidiae]MBL3635967.1 catalase HPII [Pseudomonas syringae pv. actinidiae]MBL3661714.1 catalase HPII [Pseudomonas syringae pv. actinidiae]
MASKKAPPTTDTSKSQMAGTDTPDRGNTNAKLESLEQFRSDATGQALRTNHGVKISDNQNTLKVGSRGPSLLEDFIMREKITHFDHERIPERIVHARGTAAHGYFQTYENHGALSKAGFLRDPAEKTPVFVRFSTVQGPRGSGDTVRDVRGFAVKFYTREGNFDLVGNNMPIFFIQDAIKFPDFVHAVKPEPHNEIPTGGSAHDTFWDFVSLVPESAHMVLWTMSDRAIPKSLRTMQGFGIHTFRLINTEGKSSFVKFHWKPKFGVCSLVWDEAQKLAGKDTDFHRRDLWESIEMGDYPEWELGVQIVAEEDEHKFDFDLLDPTKIIPEELVPVTPLGKMVLNRNPDNYFAETEQVAFCPGHIVPGIDFSNDPLLQGRLFSYTDTQISRLGGPNFHEIPINRPIAPNNNGQRDAQHRTTIDKGRASYEPNSIDGGWPKETPAAAVDGGFETYPERVEAHKVRERSESFGDHFSQATLFFQSMSHHEKEHIIAAYSFELGKVEREYIRARQVNEILAKIDLELASRVAANLGLPAPTAGTVPARKTSVKESPALSQVNLLSGDIVSRKVAILVANGVDGKAVEAMKAALAAKGAHAKVLGSTSAPVKTADGKSLPVDASAEGLPSVAFDAVFVPGGKDSVKALSTDGVALHFILEAYKHLKAISVAGEAKELLTLLRLEEDAGLLVVSDSKSFEPFFKAIAQHRVWDREVKAKAVPA